MKEGHVGEDALLLSFPSHVLERESPIQVSRAPQKCLEMRGISGEKFPGLANLHAAKIPFFSLHKQWIEL